MATQRVRRLLGKMPEQWLPAGMTWSGNMAVEIEYFAITQQRDSDYLKSFARPVAEWGVTDPKLISSGAFAVRLGRYTVQTRTEESLPAPAS
jgi:hypothetical protein